MVCRQDVAAALSKNLTAPRATFPATRLFE
jgi:hypothetical protein